MNIKELKSFDENRKASMLAMRTGYIFKPEYIFHNVKKWRIDFACVDLKIAIEVEGGAWTNGRHVRGQGYINDMDKYNELSAYGWVLLRCIPDKLFSIEFINVLNRTIKVRKDYINAKCSVI